MSFVSTENFKLVTIDTYISDFFTSSQLLAKSPILWKFRRIVASLCGTSAVFRKIQRIITSFNLKDQNLEEASVSKNVFEEWVVIFIKQT